MTTSAVSAHTAHPSPTNSPTLTSSETAARILSSPSTSCLKVGRCEGTACQHSLISMYLGRGGVSRVSLCPLPTHLAGTHSSWVQLDGRSMRCPSFSSLNSSSTGMPGYGEPPSVKISHIRIPKDHLGSHIAKRG